MVALNDNFAEKPGVGAWRSESASESERYPDHQASACLHRLRGENPFLIIATRSADPIGIGILTSMHQRCSLFIGHNADAYGNTLIYTGPGTGGVRFTDDDAGSGFTYGANDMIFCGYRYDPETRLYYVRNRMFLTDAGGISVGRWLQRDPIGYMGGVNLYEYVGGRAVVAVDPTGDRGRAIHSGPPTPPNYASTCKTSTAGYSAACSTQSSLCNCPATPWPCCAANVSGIICLALQTGISLPGLEFLGIPLQACLLGCINECLYQNWLHRRTPAWQQAQKTCGRGRGYCSNDCCYQSVAAEQIGLTQCAVGCAGPCGLPPALLLPVITGINNRLDYGYSRCCGAA
jgi:RHS repeat-associated protein